MYAGFSKNRWRPPLQVLARCRRMLTREEDSPDGNASPEAPGAAGGAAGGGGGGGDAAGWADRSVPERCMPFREIVLY